MEMPEYVFKVRSFSFFFFFLKVDPYIISLDFFLVLCSVNVLEGLLFNYNFHASYFVFHN